MLYCWAEAVAAAAEHAAGCRLGTDSGCSVLAAASVAAG